MATATLPISSAFFTEARSFFTAVEKDTKELKYSIDLPAQGGFDGQSELTALIEKAEGEVNSIDESCSRLSEAVNNQFSFSDLFRICEAVYSDNNVLKKKVERCLVQYGYDGSNIDDTISTNASVVKDVTGIEGQVDDVATTRVEEEVDALLTASFSDAVPQVEPNVPQGVTTTATTLPEAPSTPVMSTSVDFADFKTPTLADFGISRTSVAALTEAGQQVTATTTEVQSTIVPAVEEPADDGNVTFSSSLVKSPMSFKPRNASLGNENNEMSNSISFSTSIDVGGVDNMMTTEAIQVSEEPSAVQVESDIPAVIEEEQVAAPVAAPVVMPDDDDQYEDIVADTDTMFPMVKSVTDADMADAPEYLQSQFTTDAINTHINAINDYLTDKRFDPDAEDADYLTQQGLTEHAGLGGKTKAVILTLISLGRLQTVRKKGVTVYTVCV